MQSAVRSALASSRLVGQLFPACEALHVRWVILEENNAVSRLILTFSQARVLLTAPDGQEKHKGRTA